MSDSEYHVSSHDWPTGASKDDLTLDRIYSVLDKFDDYFRTAVGGLGRVAVPVSTSDIPPAAPRNPKGTA